MRNNIKLCTWNPSWTWVLHVHLEYYIPCINNLFKLTRKRRKKNTGRFKLDFFFKSPITLKAKLLSLSVLKLFLVNFLPCMWYHLPCGGSCLIVFFHFPLQYHGQPEIYSAILKNLNIAFTVLFTIEAMLKLTAFGIRVMSNTFLICTFGNGVFQIF